MLTYEPFLAIIIYIIDSLKEGFFFMKLVLVHNKTAKLGEENKFMGWIDSPLSSKGAIEARALGKKLCKLGIDFGIAYTSMLSRSLYTLKYIEEELGKPLKTRATYKLNPRHLGVLEGKNINESCYMYGEEKINAWLSSFDEKPPELVIGDERFPGNDEKYSGILKFELPLSECYRDVYNRVVDYFKCEISTFLKVDENVLMVLPSSVIKVLLKYLENISDEKFETLKIAHENIFIYDLNAELEVVKKEEISVL